MGRRYLPRAGLVICTIANCYPCQNSINQRSRHRHRSRARMLNLADVYYKVAWRDFHIAVRAHISIAIGARTAKLALTAP